ncbi:MAG: hypothetical protein ACYS3S_14800 [Planctomycetota bacterium]|jgi:hypothetical protein
MKEADETKVPFSSNNIRLSVLEWIIVAIICSASLCLGPALLGRLEKFNTGVNYRLPYELGNDYWLFSRYCRWVCSKYDTLVVGDSVVWGHYVSGDDTLSHYLNQNTGRERFANLGVDGFHPAALGGLLRYYGRDISGKNVIIQFNPLWMTSAKHDLQTEKEFHFNHPKLVPQFFPKIPCYKDSFSKRFSAAVKRYVPFFGWASHLRIVYFENMDLPNWTLENPYKNPMSAVTLELPTPDDDLQENISWTEKGIAQEDFQWVEPAQSLQWRFFRKTINLLEARNNTVFVVVGPFNEHMLKPDSYKIYQKMKSEIEAWLRQNDVAYCIPSVLPSELYRDASHPLGRGYAMLAKQLFENQSFKSAILNMGGD